MMDWMLALGCFIIVYLVVFAVKHENEIHNNYTEFLKHKEHETRDTQTSVRAENTVSRRPTRIAKRKDSKGQEDV